MAQRLLRIVIPRSGADELRAILAESELTPTSSGDVDGDLWAADVVVSSEGNDPLLDALQDRFESREGFRILVLPLSATLPEADAHKEEDGSAGDGDDGEDEAAAGPQRISREELVVLVEDMSEPTVQHFSLIALSVIIACVGFVQDSAPVIVGAMIIAPVLGPSMALSLATTLADLDLGKRAVRAGFTGMAAALALAAAWGRFIGLDYSSGELIGAVEAGFPELVLALASGVAGALSISSGTVMGLVGVMVAVALLPPTAAAGMLFGAGYDQQAFSAATLVVTNLICINLSAVGTFLLLGVRPRSWSDEERARTASWIAIGLWTLLLIAVAFIIARL